MKRHRLRIGWRLERRRLTAAALILLALTLLPSPAQNVTNMVANSPVVLATKTPLGTAQITLPAGTVLEKHEILPDGNIKVWQGPFMAVVPPSAASFPTPPPTPTPSPTPAPEPSPEAAPALQEPMPAPEASPSPVPGEPAPFAWQPVLDSLGNGTFDWKAHAPAAGVVLLGLYALIVTFAWLRQRRRISRMAKPELSAVASEAGEAVACPHCGKEVPLGEPRRGRHVCPTCRGPFICE